jgi:hypothetical protein
MTTEVNLPLNSYVLITHREDEYGNLYICEISGIFSSDEKNKAYAEFSLNETAALLQVIERKGDIDFPDFGS